MIAIYWLVREQDSRNDGGIDAVVAAPCFGVVVKHSGGRAANCRFPRHAVAALITHDEIWRMGPVRSTIHLDRLINLPDSAAIIGRVNKCGQLLSDLIAQPFSIRSFNDALRV